MRNILFLLLLWVPLQGELIHQDGSLHPSLLIVMEKLQISHETLDTSVQKIQELWRRPKGKERWEIKDRYSHRKHELMPYLRETGMFDEVSPKKTHYQQALVLGATLAAMRVRLAYLIQQWEKGIRFDELIFLVGQRFLHGGETLEKMLDQDNGTLPFNDQWQFSGSVPQTETEVAKLIYEQASMPHLLRQVPVIFIDSPRVNNRRPNTADTIHQWLLTNPKGSYLFISTQPWIGYQHAVIKRLLPSADFETVGPQKKGEPSIAICLDSLARQVLAESQVFH